jgi:hypothetical protein
MPEETYKQAYIRHEYARQRRLGNTARDALDYARTDYTWDSLEDAGVVRFKVIADDVWDMSWWEIDEEDKRRANDEGVWGIVGEYLDPITGEWVHQDSVWGFISDDYLDSPYEYDVKQSTIDTYLERYVESYEVTA